MEMDAGTVVALRDVGGGNNQRTVIIANTLNDTEFLGFPVLPSESVVNGKWEFEIRGDDCGLENSLNLRIPVSKPFSLFLNSIAGIYGKLKPALLDELLRMFVRFSSQTHYSALRPVESGQLPDYISASGKVLGETELFNMIDASLDMWLTTGRFNDLFEKKLAGFLGVNHVLTVNSGSSANLLALSALTSHKLGHRRLKPGDEVITVAACFPTTAAPIVQNGLIPVFADIELQTYNIDAAHIEDCISEKTRAVFLAHTLGNAFNLDKVLEICNKYNLWLIEDNCDALGTKYNGKFTGTFGHISTFSFYPAHHITMGEGGAVATNDREIYRILTSFRDWGRDCWCPTGGDNTCGKRFDRRFGSLPVGYDHKYVYSHLGYNLKITDWQAATGLAQLNRLPGFIEKRKNNFKQLYDDLTGFGDYLLLPEATFGCEPAWFGFPVTVKNNGKCNKLNLVKYLESHRIGTRELFAGNLLRQPALTDADVLLRVLNSGVISSAKLSEKYHQLLPNTDVVMKNSFWIGLWPGIKTSSINYVTEVFGKFISGLG
ncbi:MAG: lipopolysaccharide biosynthesis protein RfbH [Nitrospirae bacterium YQR-1]